MENTKALWWCRACMRADDITTPCNTESAKRLYKQGGGEGQRRGTQGQGLTRAVKVGFTTSWDTCIKIEEHLRLGLWGQTLNEKRKIQFLKHLQTQQHKQGNVVHASLHPLLQRHRAAAVSINCCHHVLQNLMKWHLIVIIQSAHTFVLLGKGYMFSEIRHVWDFVDSIGAEKLIVLPTLANEWQAPPYMSRYLVQTNVAIYIIIFWCLKVQFVPAFMCLSDLFISEQRVMGLTGLSSDTSQPRYSAACIIWAIILSTSCFKSNKRLFGRVADMMQRFKLNGNQDGIQP